ncbi:hypothetical protein BC829DRAFT_168085 [Chytridium lagenaria]|nr:hypothetical protein BC829DRAFT_168085 [Chytridium lagenaria]
MESLHLTLRSDIPRQRIRVPIIFQKRICSCYTRKLCWLALDPLFFSTESVPLQPRFHSSSRNSLGHFPLVLSSRPFRSQGFASKVSRIFSPIAIDEEEDKIYDGEDGNDGDDDGGGIIFFWWWRKVIWEVHTFREFFLRYYEDVLAAIC